MPGLMNTAMAALVTTMNDTVTGLIIKSMEYKEYDAILTILTREYGKIALRAAGVHKMGSKNAGSILPYTLAEFQFDYKPDRTMFRMKTARTKKLFRHLHEDLNASSAAAVASEAADAFTLGGVETDTIREIAEELEACFGYLDQGKDGTTVLSLYLSDIMRLSGIAPDVDECVHDGRTTVAAISIADGGFLCPECAQRENVSFNTPEEIKRFRLIVKAGLAHFDAVEKAGGADPGDLKILEEMIRLHGGMTMRSFTLFNRIAGIE
jgi:DNA repair protein RecO (recombination protein O)